ncbi:MAG TPA: chloride channel protein [Acidimicrobiia bacterium]|nr:chloride channel protein [Acidimicrobiia bacterium]
MSGRRDELRSLMGRLRGVVFWSAVTGLLTGLIVTGFEHLVLDATLAHVLGLPVWATALVPLGGLVVALVVLRVVGGGTSPATSDAYLQAFHGQADLGWRPSVARLLASVATIGSGGAMGLEGPAQYAGAAVGQGLEATLGPRVVSQRRSLLVAGAAAGVGAIFKAPATGAVFALESPYQDDLARRMLLPALIGAATGYLILVSFDGTTPLLTVHGSPPFSGVDLAGAIALGCLAGIGARVFAALLRVAKRVATRGPALPRVVVSGVTLGGLFLAGRALTGRDLVIGPGYDAVRWSISNHPELLVLVAVLGLRCLATAVTVGGGGAGGLFIPLVVAGALLGQAFDTVVGGATGLFPILGVAAFLGAGYRVPLAAVMFVAEATGRPGFIVPALLAAVAGELVMGRSSVTEYQVAAYDSST